MNKTDDQAMMILEGASMRNRWTSPQTQTAQANAWVKGKVMARRHKAARISDWRRSST